MKKKFLSLVMALCLSLSLAIPIAASESINEKINHDINTMAKAGLFVEGMTVSSINSDGTRTYAYPLTEDVTDYITPHYNDDGSIVVDVVERNCHDIITLEANGHVLINGQSLANTTVNSQNTRDTITPKVAFNYAYSATPFKGTTSSQYNVGPAPYNSRSVRFDKALRFMTGYAIGFGIATYLFPSSASQAAEVCAKIGLALKTKAEELADESNALSYKVTSYGRAGNDTFTFYKKYAGTYYTKANYKGGIIYKDLYELRTTLS